MVRSEGGRIWRNFNDLSELDNAYGAFQADRVLFSSGAELD